MMAFIDYLVSGRHAYVEDDDGGSGYVFYPAATIADDDDDGPLPLQNTRPACSSCGDPNYSLENKRCIACRIALPSSDD